MRYLFITAFITIFLPLNVYGMPRIKLDKYYWNFSKVEEGSIKKKNFSVENIGDQDLIIKEVYTSCGCTTADISSTLIKPGEKANLQVTYNSRGKISGKDTKKIYIASNDPVNPEVEVIISAEIIKQKTSSQQILPNIPVITSERLYKWIKEKKKVVILDVREKNEYSERHIPQARWFPKSKFDRGDEFTENILKNIDKGVTIVAYCGAGHRSSYVTRKLRQRGYDAYNLEGISFWEKKGYPLIRGPKLASSKEPSIIHLEEAYEHYYKLFKEDVVWIDVRNKRDYKKGHIKGALSIPLSELEDKLSLVPRDKEIVLYCEGTWEGGRCDASMSAGRILIENGFKQGKIKVFEDGYGAWENAGYPIERGEE